MGEYKVLSLTDFPLLERTTEVSSVALGGHILSCSDEWFAPASDLLKVEPAPSLKGQFGPKGALFSGWETRRHNPEGVDWVVLRLGPAGGASVVGFDIDTAHFNGNEAPEIEVYGLCDFGDNALPEAADQRWLPLLPRLPCGPSQRHLYSVPPTRTITHIKLNMIPDGGIARFRVYGTITPPQLGKGVAEVASENPALNTLDLAHVLNGGRVVYTSDQHFGKGPNVLLPGRGYDMGDGWETKRSRSRDHKDWLVIKLAEPGHLLHSEIDTAHFLGNFPESVELHGASFDGEVPPGSDVEPAKATGTQWVELLPRSKVGPGQQHFFGLSHQTQAFSHVRVTMLPDGGIKRVRLIGRRAAPLIGYTERLPAVQLPGPGNENLSLIPTAALAAEQPTRSASESLKEHLQSVQSVILTPDSFRPFGQVIAGPPTVPDHGSVIVNQGTARKYPHQGYIEQTFPASASPTTNMHLYRCDSTPLASLPLQLRMLERHQFSSQSFIPLSSPPHPGQYLIVVALNGADDRPDLSTLTSFVASASQAFAYRPGIWHLPMTPIGDGGPLDFVCIVAESAAQPELNCDEHWWDEAVALIRVLKQ